MKLLLLKVLLKRRAKDEGFTLPMVIALGLVMILLGTTNIVKSSEENINAITQNSASDALAVAEVGITKYRELLNQNRILTVYNHNQWDDANTWNSNSPDATGDVFSNVSAQACTDMATTPPGWEDGGTAAPANDTTKWWEIREDMNGDGDTTDDEDLLGRYKLVSYEYDIDLNTGDADSNGIIDDTDDNGNFNVLADVNPNFPTDTSNDNDTNNDGESDAVGILTVQGQSVDGSEAQIQVEIPLRINQEDMPNLAPALWIGSSDTSYTDNLASNIGGDSTASKLNIPNSSNIVLVDGATSGSSGCAAPDVIGTKSKISDGRQIPTIADIGSIVTNSTYSAEINTSLPVSPARLGNTSDKPFVIPADGTFDDECDSITDCRYYYYLTGATTIGTPMETDGIAKVTLYVDSNLTINQDIGSNISSSYLEIYVTSAGSITINSDTTNEINALIHAPGSQLEVTGSGTLDINGSVWVDKFINTAGATVNITPDTTRVSSSASVPSYEVYSTTSDREPRPLTSAPTNWVREEVQ